MLPHQDLHKKWILKLAKDKLVKTFVLNKLAQNNNIQVDLQDKGQDRQVVKKVQARAHTTLAFKWEQRNVTEFFGQKGKDTILALDVIWCIDDLAWTKNWSDTATYNNFANALHGITRKWLFSTFNYLDYVADQLTWMNLKPRFQKQYAVQTNDKLIIKDLSNLTMKPNENTCDLLNRVTNMMMIIKESYTNYQNIATTPITDNNNRYLITMAEQWNKDTLNNVMQFFKMQLFRAALPSKL